MLRTEERRATPDEVARLGERLVVHAVEAWVQRHSEGRIVPRPRTVDDIMDPSRWPVEPVLQLLVAYKRDPRHPVPETLDVQIGLFTGRVQITRAPALYAPEYGPVHRITRLATLRDRAVARAPPCPRSTTP